MTKKADQRSSHEKALSETAAELRTLRQHLAECEEREAGYVDQAKRLQAQYRIADAASAVEDMQGFYRQLHGIIGTLMYAENLFIALYDAQSDLITWEYWVDTVDVDAPLPTRLADQRGATGWLLRHGRTLADADGSVRKAQEAGEFELVGTASDGIGIPLKSYDETVGALVVQSYREDIKYSLEDVEVLEFVGQHISTALERARQAEEIRQRNAELAIINSVQAGLVAQMDMAAIYELVGEKIRALFDAQAVIIAGFDPQDRQMDVQYLYEKGQRFYPRTMHYTEGSMVHRLITTGQPFKIDTADGFPAGTTFEDTEPSKSGVFVPLRMGGEVRGGISLQNVEREYAFSDDDLRLLSTLAASMSISLESARLFAETQQRNSELATVNRISQVISTELDIDALIELIGEQMRTSFAADIVYVALQAPLTNMIEFRYSYGQESPPIRFGEGLTSRILESGEPLLINQDIDARTVELKTQRIGRQAKSYVGVPIIAGKQAIGVISVQSTEEEGRFTEDDVRLLGTIAGNVGTAIANARLYQEIQRRASEMATLAEIGNDIASARSLEPVLEQIAGRVMEIMRVNDIALYLKEPDKELYKPVVVLGQYIEEIKSQTLSPGQGVGGYVAQTGKGLFANFAEEIPTYSHIPGTPTEEEDPEGLMSAPLLNGDEVIGLVTVWRKHEFGLFNQQELDFLVSVARQASIAIEGARLYLEIERRAEEMSALAEVGREISATLDLESVMEQIAARARQLLDADNSAVYVPDEASGTLQALVALGDIADEIRDSPIRPGKGIIGDMAKRRVAEFVNDVDHDPRGVHIPGTLEESDEKLMAAPLMSGERLTGMMAVWRSGPGTLFDKDDLNFLTGLARQAAIAIENARLFEEAEEARAAAVEANEAKSTFLANMSHELRTPLNAIIGFTRIVQRKAQGVLADKQIENLDKVLSSAEHLLGLINTILDIAKIEAGRMDVQAATFEIAGLLDACTMTSQPLIQPGVKLNKDVADDLPPIFSDQDKVKQIVINLLSNAAKFTHKGTITISSQKRGKVYEIAVRDSGIGISEEALGRIFEEFQQADSSTTRQYGGTGLGLAISRSLARLLGGDLTAESEIDRGSTFTLVLPLRYGESALGPVDEKPAIHRPVRRIERDKAVVLAIDDDPDAIYLLQESLVEAGYRIVGAMNGDEGIQLARELHPVAITLDVMMPSKDGWQVLYELKADPATKDIPVIMVSIVDKKPMGFRLGAADYLLKPVDGEALHATLRKLVQINGKPTKRLLVVDDDPKVVDLVSQLLETEHVELTAAVDGVAALAAIEAEPPDAVLVDLMMPRLDGFGLIDRLRENPATRDIPIVVLTAKSLTADEATLLRKSAIQVIEKKGLEADELIGELQRFFMDETND